MTTTYNVRTAHGTVHRMTAGRSYSLHGSHLMNRGQRTGKADCGALTSEAADLTDAAVTCVRCAAKAGAAFDPSEAAAVFDPSEVPYIPRANYGLESALPALEALSDAQLSLLNYEYDVRVARMRRNAAVRDALALGAHPAAIAAALHCSRAAVAKMRAAANADQPLLDEVS